MTHVIDEKLEGQISEIMSKFTQPASGRNEIITEAVKFTGLHP